jgi:hypothetical protein
VGFIATAVNRSLDASSSPGCTAARTPAGSTPGGASRGGWSVGFVRREPGDRERRAIARPSATRAPEQRPTGRSPSILTDLAHRYQLGAAVRPGGRPAAAVRDRLPRRTPGFEINDLGFLRQADQQMWTSWANRRSEAQPCSMSCAGTSTTGSTEHRSCRPARLSTPTRTPSSTTAGVRAGHAGPAWRHLLRSLRPGRPSGRTLTSRPGPGSRGQPKRLISSSDELHAGRWGPPNPVAEPELEPGCHPVHHHAERQLGATERP